MKGIDWGNFLLIQKQCLITCIPKGDKSRDFFLKLAAYNAFKCNI